MFRKAGGAPQIEWVTTAAAGKTAAHAEDVMDVAFLKHARRLQEQRHARVEAALGDGRVICARCGATVADHSERCTASLDDACPGFVAIEEAGKPT